MSSFSAAKSHGQPSPPPLSTGPCSASWSFVEDLTQEDGVPDRQAGVSVPGELASRFLALKVPS